MRNQSRLELVDRILGGKLRETLEELRDGGATYDEMAAHFAQVAGIPVSRETLRRWVKQLGIGAAA